MITKAQRTTAWKISSSSQEQDSYQHEIYSPKIKVHETHISWIFLTALYAYKIKKK